MSFRSSISWVLGTLLPIIVGCQAPNSPSPPAMKPENGSKISGMVELEFSVGGMSCGACANKASEILSQIPGVAEAAVDFDSKKARVRSDKGITKERMREALGTVGFEARFPDDPPSDSTPLPEEKKFGLDIKTISHGEEIRIEDHLAEGKITIFDYYADWCGPCHLLTPKLEHLVKESKNVALRKVDISNWNSPVAKQSTREFKLSGLPFVRVLGADGKLLGEFEGNHFEKLEAMLQGKLGKK